MATWKCSICEQPILDCECHGPKPNGWRPTGGLEPKDSHPHKDTPESFWERMREIHGDDVGR